MPDTDRGPREIALSDLHQEMMGILLPRLVGIVGASRPGHCMRMTDLDVEVMLELTRALRSACPGAAIHVLGNPTNSTDDAVITSTKLVELRNPLPDGSLRSPLLIFIPAELRTSAEDSFGIATFQDLPVDDVYHQLAKALEARLPGNVKSLCQTILSTLAQDADRPWAWGTDLRQARYLLTVLANRSLPEATGAALFELGLIPDFKLHADPASIALSIKHNRACVEHLTFTSGSERARVLAPALELEDGPFRLKLLDFATNAGLDDPLRWTKRIALNVSHWGVSFDQWRFVAGAAQADQICIRVVDLQMPEVPEQIDRRDLQELAGNKILAVGNQAAKFSVSFTTDPVAGMIPSFGKFLIELISLVDGQVVKTKTKGGSRQRKATVQFKDLHRVGLADGWHRIRVRAVATDNEPILLIDEKGSPLPPPSVDSTAPRALNESEPFYVIAEDIEDIPPAQKKVAVVASMEHARCELRFAAIASGRDPNEVEVKGSVWSENGSRRGKLLTIDCGDFGLRHCLVPNDLHALEHRVLTGGAVPQSWRLVVGRDGAQDPAPSPLPTLPDIPPIRDFLTARSAFLDAVKGTASLTIQGFDFLAHRELVVTYSQSYLNALRSTVKTIEETDGEVRNRATNTLRQLVMLDAVQVVAQVAPGRNKEATLLPATHPLRALWWMLWGLLGKHWAMQAARAPKEFQAQTRESLELLSPILLPSVITSANGRSQVAVDNIHPFWTLYAAPGEDDLRGLTGFICAGLGLSEPAIGGATISGSYLADRVRRYLLQHPYVRTLTINALQPGHGTVMADMLLELQKQLPDIRYDIRLFAADPNADGLGEALAELMDPESPLTAKEADAFATPTAHPCFPKLSVATLAIADFRKNPSQYPAHLSFLFDVFQPEAVGTTIAPRHEFGPWLHGLVPQRVTRYDDDGGGVRWQRHLRSGTVSPLIDAEDISQTLGETSDLVERSLAILAGGSVDSEVRPAVTLNLGGPERALLHHLHEVSDWVVTIDRHLGLEFFDHPGGGDRPDYLIDHTPDFQSVFSHRVVITSRSLSELEQMLCPVLAGKGLAHDPRTAKLILDQLRALSGRIALKLISSPNQRAEVLGLALSRLFLASQGVFTNQIVVPLDAHLELFAAVFRDASGGQEITLKRTDLALFDLDAANRVITCHLVEVKCYGSAGDQTAYDNLCSTVADQLAMSERALQWHFDPQRQPEDRADRLMKSRELAALLGYYLDRSARHGLVDKESAAEASYFLDSIEEGFRLQFTRTGLIFDFSRADEIETRADLGVEYHRIGRGIVATLLQPVVQSSDHTVSTTSVAKLTTAQFIAPERDRTGTLGRIARLQQREQVPEAAKKPDAIPADTNQRSSTTPTTTARDDRPDPITVPENQPKPISSSPSVPPLPPEPAPVAPNVRADITLGVTDESLQFGILGDYASKNVVLDLNHTHTISLFGVQGGGKSYTLGSIIEMATLPIPGICHLPFPLATIVFHYSQTQDYQPEFASMCWANDEQRQLATLRERYGADAKALDDVILLAPSDKVDDRRLEFPGINVQPLVFSAGELQAAHWRFLMGAVGNQSLYLKQINQLMRQCRQDLSLSGLRSAIQSSSMSDALKATASSRLNVAGQYIDDNASKFTDLIRPGRLVIVDLRDEFIDKDEALGLFVVMLQLVSEAKIIGQAFNKLVVFDEAHKYIESPDLVAGLIEVVREMRHKGTSILVASQDPPSVPVSLIELSSCIIMHRFNSPQWLKHIQRANAALNSLTPEQMASLGPGEAIVWSGKASDQRFSRGAVKIHCRPRVTRHGGATKTAVETRSREPK